MLISFEGAPGLGRVGDLDGGRVRVDFFESAAEPVVGSRWMHLSDVRRVALGEQTRVFFRDGHGRWRAGRVVGGEPDGYFIRIPNSQLDVDIPETQLFVRWEMAPRDPLQVLLSGANETPRYRDVREPVRRLLVAERAATASAAGIMSSGVRMHAHQISAALRIIRDPVQRYLLADEVGMGKTIQAGMVMRQVLLDDPGNRKVGVIVPDALVGQWGAELRDKFYLSDFPTTEGDSPVAILGHHDVARWDDLSDVDLLVVDEAHLLARTVGPTESPYRELAEIAHAVPRVLMLTATPFSRGAMTHLALLHLLDPESSAGRTSSPSRNSWTPVTRSLSRSSAWMRNPTSTTRASWNSSSTNCARIFPTTKPSSRPLTGRWRSMVPQATRQRTWMRMSYAARSLRSVPTFRRLIGCISE